jgi:hypothetical protein
VVVEGDRILENLVAFLARDVRGFLVNSDVMALRIGE